MRRFVFIVFLVVLTLRAAATDLSFIPALTRLDPSAEALLDIERAGERLIVVGARGLIAYSDDEGKSWSQAESPVSVNLTAVDFPTPSLGWAVGHAGVILHSKDAGESWQLQFDGRAANQAWLAYTSAERTRLESEVAAFEAAGDTVSLDYSDTVYAMEDAIFNEEDAREATKTGPADPFLDVLFTSASEGFAVGAYGMIYRTLDGGSEWQLAVSGIDNIDRYHYYALAKDEAGVLYLAGEAGLLFHSEDGGQSWIRHPDVYVGSFFGLSVADSGVYAYGLRGTIFRSVNAGQSWQGLASPGSYSLYGGSVSSGGELLLVGAGGAMLSIDTAGVAFERFHASRATLSSSLELVSGENLLVGMSGIARDGEVADE